MASSSDAPLYAPAQSGSPVRSHLLLQLQATVGACTPDQRSGGAARGTGQIAVAGDLARRSIRYVHTETFHQRHPPISQQCADAVPVRGSNQELRLRRAARAVPTRLRSDDGGDSGGEASLDQLLHLTETAVHARRQLRVGQHRLGLGGGQWAHCAFSILSLWSSSVRTGLGSVSSAARSR